MMKPIQQPIERKLPVENLEEIIQKEINHIANSNPYIEIDERDSALHKWLDKQKQSKVCGLAVEDRGSNLSRSCYDYFLNSSPQRENLISIPLKVLYVRTSQPGKNTHLFIDLLNALKHPLNSGTLRDLRKRVRGTLKKYQVKLLIVDDAHILKRNAMVELIKIHDDLKIPVVMAGAYDLEERLSRTKGYEHINNAFFSIHSYRTLTQDEIAAFVMAWEEEVLMSWGDKDKPNLANDEEIIEFLYTRSSGLVQHLHVYLKKIAIAQLENMANPSSEKGINIYEVMGDTRSAITVDF